MVAEEKKYRELIELKGLIREKKLNYRIMAKRLNISLSAFSNKINGKTVFTLREALVIIKLLDIKPEYVCRYFF